MAEKTLYITAHPDDLEVMLAHDAMREDVTAYSLVASAGEAGSCVDPSFVEFVRTGKRIQESAAGLQLLGIPTDRQLQLFEPDGGLSKSIETLSKEIEELIALNGITRVVSLGETGYDGHLDHIATHIATVLAVANLRSQGVEVIHEALNATHQGSRRVESIPVMQSKQIQAIAEHCSQYTLHPAKSDQHDGVVGGYVFSAETLKLLEPYMPLIQEAQTFDTVPAYEHELEAA